jgi:ATP-dependent Clp protease adaptor protein ClpS
MPKVNITKKNITQNKIQHPDFYNVIMLNDDFTSMDFVVKILKLFFNMNTIKANNIMLKIHNTGQAICGIYPFEVAETKILEVTSFAKQNGYPLKSIMKKI